MSEMASEGQISMEADTPANKGCPCDYSGM